MDLKDKIESKHLNKIQKHETEIKKYKQLIETKESELLDINNKLIESDKLNQTYISQINKFDGINRKITNSGELEKIKTTMVYQTLIFTINIYRRIN